MSDDMTVAEQLEEELHAVAWSLAAAGLRFADPTDPVAMLQLANAAAAMAANLAQDSDDRLAAQTVIDIMCALWPNSAPEDCGRADWWQTSLGRLCARSLGRSDAEAVTYSVAASMLGISKGAVSTMVGRGTLDKHPDGGVLRASVLQRLGR